MFFSFFSFDKIFTFLDFSFMIKYFCAFLVYKKIMKKMCFINFFGLKNKTFFCFFLQTLDNSFAKIELFKKINGIHLFFMFWHIFLQKKIMLIFLSFCLASKKFNFCVWVFLDCRKNEESYGFWVLRSKKIKVMHFDFLNLRNKISIISEEK